MSSTSGGRKIVIIGGGIIGCTSAYYLSHHPSFDPSTTSITILEASAHGAAQGASGKAGGLVAKWAYPKALVDISFQEHEKLAEEHGGAERWGWRYVNVGNWEGKARTSSEKSTNESGKSLEKKVGVKYGVAARGETVLPGDLNWVDPEATLSYSPMAPEGDTAQVHPYLFTTSMLSLAEEKGAKLIIGRATSINQSRGIVSGVSYLLPDGSRGTLEATNVILCAGAWSPSLQPDLPITYTRAHSITISLPPATTISPYVLFTSIAPSDSTPEIYARPTNEVYVCGPGDESTLPEGVDQVEVDSGACDTLWEQINGISTVLSEGTVDKRQACYLPLGGPIVGEIGRGAKGLIIATGHTCWGICNAPGTGRAVAELVLDGQIKCGNLRSLEPKRHM